MLPAALMQGVGVEPRLRGLILRMLSVRPEERGPTAQLAEELERAEELAEARASVPQQGPAQVSKAEGTSGAGGTAESFTPRAHARRVGPWLALAAVGLALAVWTWRTVPSPPGEEVSVAEAEGTGEGGPGAEPTGLGGAAAAISLEQAPQSSPQEAVVEDTPPEPLPGQARPDAQGKCLGNKQVLINGGCWLEFPAANARECELNGYVFFKNRCYSPALPARRKPPPTSDQP